MSSGKSKEFLSKFDKSPGIQSQCVDYIETSFCLVMHVHSPAKLCEF